MEEKKILSKGKQITAGILLGASIYLLCFFTISSLTSILGIISMLLIPIAVIFAIVKLIRGVTYKVMGITLLITTAPALVFALAAGACFSIFAAQGGF